MRNRQLLHLSSSSSKIGRFLCYCSLFNSAFSWSPTSDFNFFHKSYQPTPSHHHHHYQSSLFRQQDHPIRKRTIINKVYYYSTQTSTASMMATTEEDSSSAINNNKSKNPVSNLGLPSPIILGSASFTRKLILKEMNIPYHIVVRPIDEKNLGNRSNDKPSDLVMLLGQAKANHLVQEIRIGNCNQDLPPEFQIPTSSNSNSIIPSMIVLTGDQVVTCNNQILEKPESIEEAKQFVSLYPKYPPSTVGSCILTHIPSGIQVSGVETATVYFKNSTQWNANDLVDQLLTQKEPILSCAGGLMVEHPFVKQCIDYIDGSEQSVMGLSPELVLKLLHEMTNKLKK